MNNGLVRLLTWCSPAFPIGAFAYSAGLETAIAHARMAGRAETKDWIAGNLRSGTARNDAILVAEAWRGHEAPHRLAELAEFCLALTPALERHTEMLVTGGAFAEAARAWPDPVHDRLPEPCPYPVAFGAVAGAAGIDLTDTLAAYLTVHVQAQVSVAVRLVPIGQTEGLQIQAALEPLVAELSAGLSNATTDDLGAAAYAADIAAMKHETLGTRIFRS
ncbi:urease accessory protein UreF [Nitratireductor sp. GCM10026969]|uniref:urease accessory protein UreF n=1 Tax=Nitratireductor sp. GCM10026969 TaxID=3252645 RepID=UPI00361CF96C